MSTTHHSIRIRAPESRPVRCFRHHKSMASCEDCGRVRTDQLARIRAAAPTTPRGTMSS